MILDIIRLEHEHFHNWQRWIEPIFSGKWYSKDYFSEAMEKLAGKTGSKDIMFMFMTHEEMFQYMKKHDEQFFRVGAL